MSAFRKRIKRRNLRPPLPKKKGTGGAVFLLLLLFVPLLANAASPWRDLGFKLEAFLFGPPLLVKHLIVEGVSAVREGINPEVEPAVHYGASKKSATGADSLESQDDSIRPGLAPKRSIANQNFLSRAVGGLLSLLSPGPAGNRTPEISVLTRISDHPRPRADTAYQNTTGNATGPSPQLQRVVIKEKEIIREIIVKDNGATTIVKESAIPPAPSDEKLAALKSELNESFVSRINTLVGGFGFNTNRFDDLFVQKQLELSGKLTQPATTASSPVTFSSSITSKDISATSLSLSSSLTVSGIATSTIGGPLKIAGGLTAGSGNVQIIDSTGKIPALSSSYFQALPSLFSSIGNASSTVQFSANQFQDTLSFEGIGGTTISFDSTNKKITISTTSPTLLNVLNQGADASTFTGTTKIAGLTITSSGIITAGTWQGGAVAGSYGGTGFSSFSAGDILYASATTTLSRLGIGSANTILTSSGSSPQWSSSLTLGGTLTVSGTATSTIAGPLVVGSGNVRIIDATGKIPSLSSTYLADISGANLTGLNASNVSSGTLTVSVGGTGLASYTGGDLLYASGAATLSKLGIGSANTVLTSSGSAPQWSTSLTLAGTLTVNGSNATSSKQIFLGTATDPGYTVPAIQVGVTSSLIQQSATAGGWTSNLYFANGNYKYIASDDAFQMEATYTGTPGLYFRTYASGSAGADASGTNALVLADPGLVAIGRSASTETRSMVKIGAEGTTVYDLTSASESLYGMTVSASLRSQASGLAHTSLMIRPYALADGTARTVGTDSALSIADITKDANITITTAYGINLSDPAAGGTTNRTINAASGAFLSTAGSWTSVSSREYKDILGRNTPEDYPTRIGELRALDPVYFRFKPDHLIHPLRTQEDLEKYNKENNKQYASLKEANADGIATDARFNEQTGEYEAYRFGRWEQVGSDSKPVTYGVIAEELPDIIKTKDTKGIDLSTGIAWLIGTGRASLNKIDQSSSADYAEWTRVVGDPSSYEPGDLLMFSSEDRKVTKAEPSVKDRLMGVVTLNPGPVGFSYDITKDITSGITDKSTEQIEKEYNAKMAATIGYTPIKVSTENGVLLPGDPITISSTPGVGRRAKGGEKIVGYAMESFDPDSGKMGTHDVDLPTRTYKKFFHPMTTKLPSGLWQGWVFGYVNLGYVGNDLNATLTNDQQLTTNDEPLVDKNGSQLALTHEGTVAIKRLVVKELEIAKDGTLTIGKNVRVKAFAGDNQITGKITMPQGLTYTIVENVSVRPQSHVFLSLNATPPQGIDYGVVSIKQGQFTIQLSQGAPYDLTFFYWIIDTFDTDGGSVTVSTKVNNGNASSTSSL